MSFRARLTLLAAVAVAVAVAAASGVVYVVVSGELRDEIDRSLVRRAEELGRRPGPRLGIAPLGPGPFGPPSYVQLVRAGHAGAVALPGAEHVLEVAAGTRDPFFAEGHVGKVHVRVYTAALVPGVAVQVARPLDEVDRTLGQIGLYLLFIGLGGIAIAAGLGFVVARTALAPVRRVTEVAEEVAETRDLSRRIEASGRDELSRLAGSFNEMLAALDSSLLAQRQLVADASHELRTPLASLRTNVEVLAGGKRLSAKERRRLLADVTAQVEELSSLVGDLVELDRDGPPELEDVRLDEIVAVTVERARTRAPNVEFRTALEPSLVRGAPALVERAVGNLLDNAAKWSPEGGVVEVSVAGGEAVVRDHGPGIDEADLPHVFDRFYRAASARGFPGSGLGLAIVRQVAELHGGSATVELPPDGGALFRLRLVPSS